MELKVPKYMLCPYRVPEVVVSCILCQTIHFIIHMNITSKKAAYFTNSALEPKVHGTSGAPLSQVHTSEVLLLLTAED
jgi:hypothetical protein